MSQGGQGERSAWPCAEVLTSADVDLWRSDRIASAFGPGNFTGIRIASPPQRAGAGLGVPGDWRVAFCRAWAYGHDGCGSSAGIDARQDKLFGGRYSAHHGYDAANGDCAALYIARQCHRVRPYLCGAFSLT